MTTALFRLICLLSVMTISSHLAGQTINLCSQAEVDAWDQSLTEIPVGMTVNVRGDDIANIDAFQNLTLVNGDLLIWENVALQQIDGLKNMTDLEGNLTISSNNALTQINGIQNIVCLKGILRIVGNDALTQIDGLQQLTDVSGEISISDNIALTHIDFLQQLTEVSGVIYISSNDALTQIDGVQQLTEVSGEIFIADNDALAQIDGFENITEVFGKFIIHWNDALTHVDFLQNISNVFGTLQIASNDSLTQIDGLVNIIEVTGLLQIFDNDALKNVDGLKGLTDISGKLTITSNDILDQIDGLQNLNQVSGSLQIVNNQALSDCCVLYILLVDENQDIEIMNNDSGCNSVEEILSSNFINLSVLDTIIVADIAVKVSLELPNLESYIEAMWTTSGDGEFVYVNMTTTDYYLGNQDLSSDIISLQISAISKCSELDQIVIIKRESEIVSSLNPIKDSSSFKVFPMPFNDHVTIQFNQNVSGFHGNVYDISGAVITSITIPSGVQQSNIKTPDWISGIYTLQLTENNTGHMLSSRILKVE